MTHSKPDPEGYLKGARRLQAAPGTYAVVEDSLAGLRAGRAAGAYVIGLTTTNAAEAVGPLADITLHTVADISAAMLHD